MGGRGPLQKERGVIQSTINTMISHETVYYTVLVSFYLFHLRLSKCIQGDPIPIISDVAWGREEEKRKIPMITAILGRCRFICER